MPSSRRICFIANNERFFFRHFRPAIQAALAQGYEIFAYLPPEEDQRSIPDPYRQHVTIVRSPIGRNLTVPVLGWQVAWLVKNLRQHEPNVVVAFSVRTALALSLALRVIRVKRIIIYVTGLGLLELLFDRKSRLFRSLAYRVLRRASQRANCYFIFENRADPINMGFAPGQPPRQRLLMGAGVDEAEFSPTPLPPFGPLKLATVSRLVWSKGVDLAVQAVTELVSEGYAVELSIYGVPDHANPRAIEPRTWASRPGIFVKGHTEDVPAVWAQHHAAIFPSRGGEGVPRSLLEAAACGRPSIVTNVSGCADFVRDGIDGYISEAGSVSGLKRTILKLLAKPDTLAILGEAARQRFLQTSAARIVREQYEELFDLANGNDHLFRQ